MSSMVLCPPVSSPSPSYHAPEFPSLPLLPGLQASGLVPHCCHPVRHQGLGFGSLHVPPLSLTLPSMTLLSFTPSSYFLWEDISRTVLLTAFLLLAPSFTLGRTFQKCRSEHFTALPAVLFHSQTRRLKFMLLSPACSRPISFTLFPATAADPPARQLP